MQINKRSSKNVIVKKEYLMNINVNLFIHLFYINVNKTDSYIYIYIMYSKWVNKVTSNTFFVGLYWYLEAVGIAGLSLINQTINISLIYRIIYPFWNISGKCYNLLFKENNASICEINNTNTLRKGKFSVVRTVTPRPIHVLPKGFLKFIIEI